MYTAIILYITFEYVSAYKKKVNIIYVNVSRVMYKKKSNYSNNNITTAVIICLFNRRNCT